MEQNCLPNFSSASVYVGDLDWSVTEEMIFQKFSPIKSVISIRIFKIPPTKCYAYVNFEHPEQADTAIRELNLDTLNGRPMRVMRCQRDPSLRNSGKGNIFIKNLRPEIDSRTIYNTFSGFGNVLSVKVPQAQDGSGKGYGYVQYDTEASAKKAIEKINGRILNGRKVHVGNFIPRRERVQNLREGASRQLTNLYVKNIGEEFTDEQLRRMFQEYGRVDSCKVMCHDDGRSKGFAFVSFEKPEDAEAAMQGLKGTELSEGKPLYVGFAQNKTERRQELKIRFQAQKAEQGSSRGANLYVKYLDKSIDDERLQQEFSPFGTITSAKVMKVNDRSRGFGFVRFSTPEEAAKAKSMLHRKVVGSKALYVGVAQRKEERKELLAAQYMQHMAKIPMDPNRHRLEPETTNEYFLPTISELQTFYGPPQDPRWLPPPQIQSSPAHHVAPPATYTTAPLFPIQATVPRRIALNPQGQNFSQNFGQAAGIPYGYTVSVRNTNATPIQHQSRERWTAATFASTPLEMQYQILGQALFQIVERMYPHLASKIVGMLLELDVAELVYMLDDYESLKNKVEEAFDFLQAHRNQATPSRRY